MRIASKQGVSTTKDALEQGPYVRVTVNRARSCLCIILQLAQLALNRYCDAVSPLEPLDKLRGGTVGGTVKGRRTGWSDRGWDAQSTIHRGLCDAAAHLLKMIVDRHHVSTCPRP